MAIVVLWLPQLAGPVRVVAGWPGSNGSTMSTNPAAEAELVPPGDVAAELVEPPAGVVDPEELQAASRPARAMSTAARAVRFTRITIEPAFPATHVIRSDRSGDRGWPATGHNAGMTVRVDDSLDGIDWRQAKADLAADDFDNGRSPQALQASFARSQHVAIARDGDRVVGMARLLSDGVCNAYLLDVWTHSAYRRQGIASAMVRQLMAQVPGQHVGLQTDEAEAFYAKLGYAHQPVF